MKLLFAFALLLPLKILSQENNFKIVDQVLVWEKIFDSPTAEQEDLTKLIRLKFVSVSDNFYSESNQATFQMRGDKVDLQKQNRKMMSSPMICSRNLNYHVTIELKDGKYRVQLSDLYIDDTLSYGNLSGTFTDYFTKKHRAEIEKSKNAKDAMHIFDEHFTQKFTLQPQPQNSEW